MSLTKLPYSLNYLVTVNDQLKNFAQIEHTRHRSVMNFMVNLVDRLISYTRQLNKPRLRLHERDSLFIDSSVDCGTLPCAHSREIWARICRDCSKSNAGLNKRNSGHQMPHKRERINSDELQMLEGLERPTSTQRLK